VQSTSDAVVASDRDGVAVRSARSTPRQASIVVLGRCFDGSRGFRRITREDRGSRVRPGRNFQTKLYASADRPALPSTVSVPRGDDPAPVRRVAVAHGWRVAVADAADGPDGLRFEFHTG